jgi:hypothetical protein
MLNPCFINISNIMKSTSQILAIALASAFAFCTLGNAQTIVDLNTAASGFINAEWDGANATFESPNDSTLSNINFVGAMNATSPGASRIPVLAFTLPTLAGTPTSAIVSFDMRSADAVSSNPWFNVDAYGFTTAPTASDWFVGATDGSKTLLANDLLTPSVANGATITIDITSYLEGLYTGGTPNIATLYIRLNPDVDLTTGDGFGRYRTAFVDGSGNSLTTLTIIPEASTYAALLGAIALSFVFMRRRR